MTVAVVLLVLVVIQIGVATPLPLGLGCQRASVSSECYFGGAAAGSGYLIVCKAAKGEHPMQRDPECEEVAAYAGILPANLIPTAFAGT